MASDQGEDEFFGRGGTAENTSLAEDKVVWSDVLMGCFNNVRTLFGTPELRSEELDSDWEVPFDSITELTYLSSGAQGMVYSGKLNNEMVAVKKVREKSETNVKHLGKLNHKNIVRFRGVCTENPYCLIMEYCQYGSLFEFLHSGTNLLPKQLVEWAKDIALGVSYLHSHKIIHRDLKSPNVLISDNLTVKVTDFGTSRVWDNESTVMSFTGTVAWMAPEVIRQEPCSERVDVWSYAVVLWEMLTREVPYQQMETHAIMWGVGTDSLSLPVPTGCPSNLQVLLSQCWSRVPRMRPSFKIILAHLDMAADDILSLSPETFNAKQEMWRQEVQLQMERIFAKSENPAEAAAECVEQQPQRRDAIRAVKQVYEQQLTRANELFMEVCAVRLQLEERERVVEEREKLLKTCRCGVRKPLNIKRQTSSSSDGKPDHVPLPERRKKKGEARLLVNYVDNADVKTYTVAIDKKCLCEDHTLGNNNIESKETTVEENGNVELQETASESDIMYQDYFPDCQVSQV